MAARRSSKIEIHPLTPERWADLVDLFERRGPRGGRQVVANCWCMYWRRRGDIFGDGWGAGNRRAFGELVQAGDEPGLLAYLDGVPVGWVGVAPREEFPRIEHSPTIRPIDDRPAWSINCFYVHRAGRQRGVARALLRAAIDFARSKGATLVEGYPVRSGGADDYTGFQSMFEAEGFREVARRSPRRAIVQRALRPRATPRCPSGSSASRGQ